MDAAETFFSALGRWVIDFNDEVGQFVFLIRSALLWSFRAKIEWRQTMIQIVRIGVESIPIAALVTFFTGMVFALQTGISSVHLFNEPLFIGTVVGFAIVMELSPVMTSLAVLARAGAAIAAEVGTMKVTEQIDALYTLGTDPVRYIVIPRVLAFILILPILSVISDFTGILGGWVVATLKFDVAPNVFWHDIIDHMVLKDFFHGYLKNYVFAAVIAFICCFKGLTTKGGAEGVGKSTTSAVVLGFVLVLVLDYFVSAILVAVGIN